MHGQARDAQQVLGIGVARAGGHTDAHRRRQAVGAHHDRSLGGDGEALRHQRGISSAVEAGHEDQELVSRAATHEVVVVDHLGDAPCEHGDHVVAGLVGQRLVHGLEAVDPDAEDGDAPAGRRQAVDGVPEPRDRRRSGREAGERVVPDGVLELDLRLDGLLDVAQRDDPEGRVVVVQERLRSLHGVERVS